MNKWKSQSRCRTWSLSFWDSASSSVQQRKEDVIDCHKAPNDSPITVPHPSPAQRIQSCSLVSLIGPSTWKIPPSIFKLLSHQLLTRPLCLGWINIITVFYISHEFLAPGNLALRALFFPYSWLFLSFKLQNPSPSPRNIPYYSPAPCTSKVGLWPLYCAKLLGLFLIWCGIQLNVILWFCVFPPFETRDNFSLQCISKDLLIISCSVNVSWVELKCYPL